MKEFNSQDLKQLYRPAKDSHKGQNGKLLVIGGSQLFHASAFWAAAVASRMVDLVHFSSPAMENNELMRRRAKEKFWEGIVVGWERVESYIKEDDCVLIGPGMPRHEGLEAGETATGEIVNRLLVKYPSKRWVIDGGALQELEPGLLRGSMIITPHRREWERVNKTHNSKFKTQNHNAKLKVDAEELVKRFSTVHDGVTVLLKGMEDIICRGEECVRITGGNEGMTKGGTGDVLAGLTAGFYCKNEALLSAAAASYINKKAGDNLYARRGTFYNAGDLLDEVGRVIKEYVFPMEQDSR